jgi:2,5-dichlorohydroquinone reductive dechlorinase
MTIDLLAAVAAARAPLASPTERIGSEGGAQAPRFELFHAPNSICSQKVRAVLAHHGLAYTSNTMSIVAGETYLPGYVRLRMHACALAGLPLADVHTGSTAVTTGGCDPAVVPTLVDWDAGHVVIDSKRICIYLDEAADGALKLREDAIAQAVDAELHLVDSLPNYQMLVGRAPDPQRHGASPRAGTGVHFAMGKVARCDRYLAEFADDEVLRRGYGAKRAKELSAAEKLFTPEAMQAAYGQAEAACAQLEQTLAAGRTPWIFGDAVSMADLFWAIELLRMKNLGAHTLWDDGLRPQVAAYVRRCEAAPAIRAAVIEWPGALH